MTADTRESGAFRIKGYSMEIVLADGPRAPQEVLYAALHDSNAEVRV
jgi:hypothetical protein